MKPTLKPGLTHAHRFAVTDAKTVPNLYPEAASFQEMPRVFATGFMVGLLEWACVGLLRPQLDPGEGSLGLHVDVSHTAATPPGMEVTVEAKVEAVEGRRVDFSVALRDEMEEIARGRHRRAVVRWDAFNARVAAKAAGAKN
ncbi:MAG: thioesterase family protein [Rhodospirillales bacterium]